ncbi:maleylpyruvate isomerase family mycothiol-dependent enzyme [Nonomuraea sp. NPDC049504]|uniref:maleylpyruvate isomerase family mycothiol-dependent enzyme n=1 Tax=Nonomuraea sp. NPDC049504 TaxID=3154729 RepID=UPI0034129358
MTTLDQDRLAEGLREQGAAFGLAVAGGDPEAKVPTCPEWRLRVLTGHASQATRWAAGLVRAAGTPLPVPDPLDALPGAPDAWASWLRDGAEDLITAVRTAAPGASVWSFNGPVPPVFWLRRMLCDTAVHHYDAAATTGAPYTIADDLAADVITEAMELITAPASQAFKPELTALRGQGERLAVRPDGMTGWLITRTPDGPRWERSDADADMVLSGPVAECMLVLARRVPPARVHGDRALLRHWLDHTVF